MATSGNIFCGPCETQDTTKLAEHWCPECEEGLCFDCQKHHSASKATRDHGIISIENYRKMPKSTLEVSHHCKEHDKRHQNYCPQHDQLCCPVCISTTHKKCTDLLAISEVIKKSKTSSLLANMEGSLQDIKKSVEQVINNTKENLSIIEIQRQKCIDEVKQMRIKINCHLDTLENTIINELLAAEKEAKERIGKLWTEFCKTAKTVDKLQTSVLALKIYGSDLQTFFGSKAMESEVDALEKYIKSVHEDGRLQEINLKFTIDEKISSTISYLSKFGTVSVAERLSSFVMKTEKEKQAQIMAVIQQPSAKTIHDIKVSLVCRVDTRKNSDLRGCVGLTNGHIVLTDCGNKRLIMLNSKFSFDKAINLAGKVPYDVTAIHDTLVAVSTDESIDVIDLNSADIPIKSIKHMIRVKYCGVNNMLEYSRQMWKKTNNLLKLSLKIPMYLIGPI